MSQTRFTTLARIAMLSMVVSASVRCAPAQVAASQPSDGVRGSASPAVATGSAAALPLDLGAVEVPGPPRLSLDVVRARVDSRRRVVAVEGAGTALDTRVAAVARELSASGTPPIGTELRLVFATREPPAGKKVVRDLVAIELGSGAKARRAFHVVDERTGIDGFYDASGRPVERVLLRYPVAHLVITSRFATVRKHPILKKDKPHLGVDFAAPRGTPVLAAGDGEIIAAGWSGPFGRQVRIRHEDGLVTVYAHLDRIASGVSVGARVERGEVVGAVGASGLATGPHLHFGLIRNGKFVDPLTTALPAPPALPPSVLTELRATIGEAELLLAAASERDGAIRVARVTSTR